MTRNPRQRILTAMALSLVGAALAVNTAQAGNDDRPGVGVGAPITHDARPDAEPGTIPYLSHGIGVDETLFSGERSLGLTGDSVLTRAAGVGVEDRLDPAIKTAMDARTAEQAAARPSGDVGPIPYLSHGIGVDESQFSGRSTTSATRPDDRGTTRGPGVFTVPPVPTTSVSADDFQWGDASAGAGAMLAALLLAAGLALSIRHRGRTILP